MTYYKKEIATLGGGCFWCTEAVFRRVRGVREIEAGYTGGALRNPSYEDVCRGVTGHAEVVRITFDADEIGYYDLVAIFFHTHDPTMLNRQGYDIGTQYRSVIFFHSEDQRRVARTVKAEIAASKLWDKPLVTQIVAATEFYRADDHQQNYYTYNHANSYCTAIIAPKLAKLEREFADRLVTAQ